ncbi:MAG TPA: ATP-grasp domain-containing protein [Dongiaceae bacterium]|nr:ATP-grasp domain-containing protein [Dongiaceae bacterium]
MNNKSLVVLIGCGVELYRRYLLEQLSEGYDVWLVSDENVTWQSDYIVATAKVSDYKLETLKNTVADIKKQRPVHGIVCWDERYIQEAVDMAVHFGLPAPGTVGIRACRDKFFGRERLAAAGLPQPRSNYCANIDEVRAFARTLSYPVVVKPRAMGGSIGVARVENEAELLARFAETQKASMHGPEAFFNGALIEEFVEGPEISIDGSVVNGIYTPLFVARKMVGLPPHFEEIGHLVRHDDELMNDPALMETLRIAHKAIEFQNGITHTELKLTKRGFVIIEVNGRLGGDLIPFLATLSMGLKPGLIAGQVACGDSPVTAEHTQKLSAAIRFRYPDTNLVVSEIVLPQRTETDGIYGYCVAFATPGAKIGIPPMFHLARAGYAIAVGKKDDACLSLSEKLANQIQIKGSAIEREPAKETANV